MTCKNCGMVIIMGGCFSDQCAQERGFCGEGCRSTYEEIKERELKKAEEA